uniref:Uncharacterized protein n=1 Tax=Glossina brevipalpis TaxID=37001 RepID=A0A1A9X0C8_9MUSC
MLQGSKYLIFHWYGLDAVIFCLFYTATLKISPSFADMKFIGSMYACMHCKAKYNAITTFASFINTAPLTIFDANSGTNPVRSDTQRKKRERTNSLSVNEMKNQLTTRNNDVTDEFKTQLLTTMND